ncbi:MAG: hypothetical protein K1X94_26865 [Sandaracinaceae bacterium]|nr:hypothetical protein [Sandaracinaceae bacterium]
MLDVDLSIPIAILTVAVVVVLAIRTWASWLERRMDERTDALVRELRARKSSRPEDQSKPSEDGQEDDAAEP